MEASASILIPELRVSPRWVMLGAAVLSMLLVPLSKPIVAATYAAEPLNLAILAYALAGVVWLTDGRWPRFARWLASAALVALVLLGLYWLRAVGFLALLPLPVVLAALLAGPLAAPVVAACESLALLPLLRWAGAGQMALSGAVVLAALWAAVAAVMAVYRPVRQLSEWFERAYDQAQGALEEARQHKSELDQTLESLAHANRQLALASERMAALRLIAEDAQKAKTMFLAKVSHEFRTPLNMIIGLVGLIVRRAEADADEEEVSPRLLEDLRVVYRNCEHLSAMINDVLDLSQVDAGRMALHREQVDLRQLVEEALEVVRPLLEMKGLGLRVNLPASLPPVYCDRVRIRQVVLNLLSNAARFTAQGHVAIRAEASGQRVVVQVSDTGPGIAPEDAQRIFEPFDQGAARPWQEKGGSGLGLAISRHFVRLHGGRIWLESQPGRGSTFVFELPIAPPSEPTGPPGHWIREDWVWREAAFRTDGVVAPERLRRTRVLVVDETGELCPQLSRVSDEIEFVDAGHPAQALATLRETPAHLVLVNTAELAALWPCLESLRVVLPQTPIVGCAIPRTVARALRSGATDYLTKPVLPDDLERALGRLGRPPRRVLVVDDDPDVVRLFRGMLALARPEAAVDAAANGREALEAMRRTPPDLVLLDVVMPEMDGWQFLQAKQDDEALRDIPVIVISALDPTDQPFTTPALVGAYGQGLSLSQLLHCALAFPGLVARSPSAQPGQESLPAGRACG